MRPGDVIQCMKRQVRGRLLLAGSCHEPLTVHTYTVEVLGYIYSLQLPPVLAVREKLYREENIEDRDGHQGYTAGPKIQDIAYLHCGQDVGYR